MSLSKNVANLRSGSGFQLKINVCKSCPKFLNEFILRTYNNFCFNIL